jgi:hypothetical protein
MMSWSLIRWGLNWTVVISFTISGLFHLSGAAVPLEVYDRWGFPREFNNIIGSFELVTALLLAIPGTKLVGSVTGGVVAFAAALTVFLRGDFTSAFVAIALLTLVGVNQWSSPQLKQDV